MSGNYKKWLDRINAKQDVLTEDNVGQFMDSELDTKSIPTSGDTVLGRDSLTGKAVEIPTDKLGVNEDALKTTKEVKSTVELGGVKVGDTIETGTTIQMLTELLFDKTLYPSIEEPTFSLKNNVTGLKEVGSSLDVELTFTFTKGRIVGNLDGNGWDKDLFQGDRAGDAISYTFNGITPTQSNNKTVTVIVTFGINTLTGSVTYGAGAQPKDSKGENYDIQLSGGTSQQTTTFTGFYPCFYYKSTSQITPNSMKNEIANGNANKLLVNSSTSFTVDFKATGQYVAIAYPASSTTKKKWSTGPLDSVPIPGGVLGDATILPCSSPEGYWSNVNYKIHVSSGLMTINNPVQISNS